MNFSLSPDEIVGFLAFCALVGPALIYVGALGNRVRSLERNQQENRDQHTRLFTLLDEVSRGIAYLRGRENGTTKEVRP